MKKILVIWFGLMALGFTAAVAGGFKLINPAHPQIATGVFSDFKGRTDAGGALALVTYAPAEWVPLSIGGTLGSGLGGPSVGLGTSFNFLPTTKAAVLAILNDITKDGQYTNLKDVFKPAIVGTSDIKMSFGPAYSLVFYNGLKSRGVWLLFTGAEWKF